MIHGQNDKTVQLVHPVAGSAAATDAATFDTLGFDYAKIIVSLGTSGTSATDNPSVMAIYEGTSTTYGTTYTAVSGTVGDTDFTIPLAAAATNKMQVKFLINTKARQRYLAYVSTLGAATNNSVVAELSRAEQAPITAAGQGVDTLVIA